MTDQINFDSIRVGSATTLDTGEKIVIMRFENGENLVFSSSFTPAVARAIAADLIERAEFCEAAEQQANDVAAKFLAKYQAQEH